MEGFTTVVTAAGVIGLLLGILLTWVWMNRKLVSEMRERSLLEESARRIPVLEKQIEILAGKRDELLEQEPPEEAA